MNPGNHTIDYAAEVHLEPKPLFTTLGSYDKPMVRPYDVRLLQQQINAIKLFI